MIEPPPARRSAGMPYLQPRNTPLALTSSVWSQTASSVEIASSSLASMMPALLNSTFSLPNAFSAASTICWQSRAAETSARTKIASLIIEAVSRPDFSSRSTTATFAPSLANSSADCLPMPLPPPVMRATLLSSRMLSDSLEVSPAFPVGDGLVVGRDLGPEEVRVVLDHVGAEGAPGEIAGGEQLGRLRERARHVLQVCLLYTSDAAD